MIENREQQIKSASEIIAYGCSDELRAALIQDFPELAESKDERIRKAIIGALNDTAIAAYGDTTIGEMLAYLEKQKEQTKEYPHSVIENAISFLTERNDGMPKDEARNIVNAVISVIKPEHWPRYRIQKPAEWSEEDEHRRTDAIYFLETAREQYALKSAIDEAIDWLKSLRPQPHWKPSEEQMAILDKVFHYLWADRNATADMQDGLGDLIEVLKKL